MERLCTLNTATLSTRTHLAPNSAQNTLNNVYRSFKVTHFGITELKGNRKTAYNYIIMWASESEILKERSASPFARTPLSFGAPCLGNPCEYSHVLYF